jgi:alkylation response protein AidB-like acyl-CoA dehydrogenase
MNAAPRAARPPRFVLTEEERMVQESARAFVAERMGLDRTRALRGAGFDRAVWTEMAGLGWPGTAVPEASGGAGLGVRALAAILEQMGRTLAPSPLASTALTAAVTLARCAPAEAADWLGRIAQGDAVAALATEEGPRPAQHIAATISPDGRLQGCKRYVADAEGADLLLVSARRGDEAVLALVDAAAPGVSVSHAPGLDGRTLSDVTFEAAPVAGLLAPAAGRDPVELAQDCARVGLACEMLGASQAASEATLEHLRTRRQFDQPIGAFQALQHRAAKLFIELELVRSSVWAAVDALHHEDAETPLLTSLAKAQASELMRAISYEMIQMHGGMGMTDAHDAGLYLKRGRVCALLHGDAEFHAQRYARLKGW